MGVMGMLDSIYEDSGNGVWYYDTGDGKCKENTAERPSWLNQLFDDPGKCCSYSWDVRACVDSLLGEDPDTESDNSLIFIELTAFGSVELSGMELPSQASPVWDQLKFALM